ncbi:MarR family winged helix-turn-helix transcriptional regulator [Arthrobacter sp.]|uniref:MarR family winged helix-turn-helix transcriptional regulator n=1 Tax=Arthrobacter sp. TaxID=1667 RepID=UPI0026DFFC28|nr:MarR family transcriptional regulator [Arthrobacter sp.]MDO5754226.1 MarR family transcriptional regulator [Arthrobacter sp.]
MDKVFFMKDSPSDERPRMHPASVLLRQILELNEVMEFAMRREMSLNETDFQAMQHLIKHRSMSPGELAQFLHLTAAATTTVIDRLVRRGHITRTPHPTDRRRLLISPSAESVKDTMARLMPMILEVDAKVRSYDDSGQEAIVDFLASVASSMHQRAAALEDKTLDLPLAKQQNRKG